MILEERIGSDDGCEGIVCRGELTDGWHRIWISGDVIDGGKAVVHTSGRLEESS